MYNLFKLISILILQIFVSCKTKKVVAYHINVKSSMEIRGAKDPLVKNRFFLLKYNYLAEIINQYTLTGNNTIINDGKNRLITENIRIDTIGVKLFLGSNKLFRYNKFFDKVINTDIDNKQIHAQEFNLFSNINVDSMIYSKKLYDIPTQIHICFPCYSVW